MSEIVKSQIDNAVPSKTLKDCMMVEVESWVADAFKQLDYVPKNLEKALDVTWHNASSSDTLSDFIYAVWRCDS